MEDIQGNVMVGGGIAERIGACLSDMFSKHFFCVYELCYFRKLIWEPFEADTGRESMTEEREKGAAGEDAAGADQGKGLSMQLVVFETMFQW